MASNVDLILADPSDFNGGKPVSATNPLPVSIIGQQSPTTAPGAALDGTDATGITPPTGAVGIRGWLSGIYARLTGTLTVAGQAAVGTPPVNPPLSVSGVDGSGNKQHLLTDASGRQIVSVSNGVVTYAAPATGSVTATSAQLVATGAYTSTLTITTLPSTTGNVYLSFTSPAIIGGGYIAFAGGGSVTLSKTGPLAMPAAGQAIYAISDSGTVAVAIQGA